MRNGSPCSGLEYPWAFLVSLSKSGGCTIESSADGAAGKAALRHFSRSAEGNIDKQCFWPELVLARGPHFDDQEPGGRLPYFTSGL